jgi:putative FmdB family regulatory protein
MPGHDRARRDACCGLWSFPVPLYEYECEKNGHRFELIRKFSDPPVTTCIHCKSKVKKLLSAPAIAFKGTGWYVTDYAGKSGGNGSGGTGSSSSEDSSGDKSSKKEASTGSADPSGPSAKGPGSKEKSSARKSKGKSR